uniref:NADH-ubiquinone oxidoreductase chain 5 n=1 Tax=Psolodesmus mandarinus TaxID=193280 RepID=A0A4P2SJL1_9ODON|nr:NADH dehydrogenase subunit 5 [Psolodesmus mandarinus]AWH61864.1 NADH dehydrogenase subunit 5 [Psolodesmus mandarinus]
MSWRLNVCFFSFNFLLFFGLLSLFLGGYFRLYDLCYFIDWYVCSINSVDIVMTFLFDWMSLIFMGFVLFISSMVILYTRDYMDGDVYIVRFVLLVLLFVLSMMLLIISPNMVSILLGWDGLGLVSYLLVIYYQSSKSYGSGMLTVMSNRLGDVAFLLGIAWMFNFGSWNYVFYVDMMGESLEACLVSFMMIFAAMTKSAQIPFSSWLPAAMAAPTPVSALVHSSTLVTAGVYLMIRFNSLVMGSGFSFYLLVVGGATMFMSGLGANFEFDLKKIIALSTLSQLGLMMSILSMGYPDLAFFHLLTHALFKALLFMCAGSIIHNLGDCQDIRYMGSLIGYMPVTSACFCVSNLALCGMPFLAGFYSKDLILELSSLSFLNLVSFFFFFFSTGLTVCYTLRLLSFTVFGGPYMVPSNCVSDDSLNMNVGMYFMVFMSVVGGSFLSWIIFPVPMMICLPFLLKILALLVSIFGAIAGYFFSFYSYSYSLIGLFFLVPSSFSGSMWYMPYLSTRGVCVGPLSSGQVLLDSFDHGWCELLGAQGFYYFFRNVSRFVQSLQINLVKAYLFSFLFFVFVFFLF